MFIPVWVVFVVTGLLMAVGTVFWSVRSGQFEEQDRARFLPLGGLSSQQLATPPPVKGKADFYANMAIIVSGLVALAITTVIVCQYL
jgi:hypothetical protein